MAVETRDIPDVPALSRNEILNCFRDRSQLASQAPLAQPVSANSNDCSIGHSYTSAGKGGDLFFVFLKHPVIADPTNRWWPI